MISGASVANFVQALFTKRPIEPIRTIINYDITFLMQPFALGGTVLGFVLNRWLPDWAILSLLTVTLIITIYRTGKKGWSLFKKERASKPQSEVELTTNFKKLDGDEENDSALIEEDSVVNEDEESEITLDDTMIDDTPPPKLKAQLEENETKTPWIKVLIQVAILAMLTIHSLLLGGKGGVSVINIRACSAPYWLLMAAIIPVLTLITLGVGVYLRKLEKKKVSSGFEFAVGDVHWTTKQIIIISLISLLGGIIASLLGLGGGIIVGPVLVSFIKSLGQSLN